MEQRYSPKQVIDSPNFETEMIIFNDPIVNEFFLLQLFLLSMFEQVTRQCEEGRLEDMKAEVKISHISFLFCLFVGKPS